MASFVFGKQLDYYFTALVDGDPVDVNSIVSARLYDESPTEAQIENTDTGHIEEVTTWTTLNGPERKIVFAAVVDSTKHSSEPYETYWVVVNFLFESGGDEVFVTETIRVFRPDSWTSRISVTPEDVLNMEPEIGTYRSKTEIQRGIDNAVQRVFYRLRGMGYDKARLYTVSDLNYAVLLGAVSGISLGLATVNAEHWKDIKHDSYEPQFEEVWKLTKLELVDSNSTHQTTASTSLQTAALSQVNVVR